jgi:hypothetical protein
LIDQKEAKSQLVVLVAVDGKPTKTQTDFLFTRVRYGSILMDKCPCLIFDLKDDF